MKKLILVLCVLFSLNLDAQFVTTLAKNAAMPQEGGVMYSLPRNVIGIEFTVEETHYQMGPYSEYASNLLGLTNYIRENKTEINIIDADVFTGTEADPQTVYFINQDEKSKEPMPNIILNEDGVILAIGYDSIPFKATITSNKLIYNNLAITAADDITFIDIVETNEDDDDEEGGGAKKKLTKEDKANIALEQIRKIRNSHFEIVSGFQEVAYGDATQYMAESLKNLENEYISLFKGKVVKHIYKKVFYLTPEKDQANGTVTIAKLSNTDGLVDANSKGGETVKVQFDTKNALSNVFPLGDDTKNSAQTNKVFYRMPVSTNMKVIYDNKILVEKRLNISQFGEIQIAPAKGSKMLFNPNTGQIITNLK